MKLPLVFLLSSIGTVTLSQSTNRENYDIRQPGREPSKACLAFGQLKRTMPYDARFSTLIQGDSVLLMHSDERWFWEMIHSKNDGIAIDLVYREQFGCDNVQRFAKSWSHRGFLLPPLYRDQIQKSVISNEGGYITIYAGTVPRGWRTDELDANYLVLQDKNLCLYTGVVNVDYHGWDLLKMGLYYDTLNREKLQEKFRDLSKTLHFTIPFEKDKSEYKKEDIRPLYDSLRLTDYEIKAIRVHAYTSVEGSVERNQKLQQQRAESIVRSLQSFQSETMKSGVQTSENWVEFLEAISSTNFKYMTPMSKEEIKQELAKPAVLNTIEPLLKKHRKAMIELDLEKRVSYLKSKPEELKKLFEQQIARKNIDEALYLQQVIFYKVGRQELPDQFLNSLEVPQALEYGSLLINDVAFRYEMLHEDVLESIAAFERLDALLKNNPRIKYNLCALKLHAWLQSRSIAEPGQLDKEIIALKSKGVATALVRRLQINFNIIMSDFHLSRKNYAEKDRCVKFIYDSYKAIPMKDDDLVNLAKYFSYNSKFDWAERILLPRIKALDVSEDLLFYYLTLTIFEERNTKSSAYRAVMLNAVNVNQARFCGIFNSMKKGGVSFQLLADPYLKKTYCENCR